MKQLLRSRRLALALALPFALAACGGGGGGRPGGGTTDASQTFTYDAMGRLTQVAYADGTTVTYSYDAAGNRLSETVRR